MTTGEMLKGRSSMLMGVAAHAYELSPTAELEAVSNAVRQGRYVWKQAPSLISRAAAHQIRRNFITRSRERTCFDYL